MSYCVAAPAVPPSVERPAAARVAESLTTQATVVRAGVLIHHGVQGTFLAAATHNAYFMTHRF
jgi:hypothetical protein